MDYLCESLHLTTDIEHHSCAAAIYLDISLEHGHPNNLDVHIRNLCSFTYYELLVPPPRVLQTQDEILLANLPPNWQLICDEQVDRPFKLTGAIYTVINCDDLCTCGILAQEVYLHESMCTCPNPDTKLTLYYVYNRALTNYDPDISGYTSRQYAKKPYSLTAPDITYTQHQIHQHANGSITHHVKRHSPESGQAIKEVQDMQMPLPDTVHYMEHKTPVILDTAILPVNISLTEDEEVVVLATPMVNMYFNIITLVNFICNFVIIVTAAIIFKDKGWLYQCIVAIFQKCLLSKL